MAPVLRLGELLDLELDCLLDFASHGSWLKVPLGKLATERTVPLDEVTLAALDGWTAQRGAQRALPHPRHGQPTDFLFLERGRRLSPTDCDRDWPTRPAQRVSEAATARPCTSPLTSYATPTAPP